MSLSNTSFLLSEPGSLQKFIKWDIKNKAVVRHSTLVMKAYVQNMCCLREVDDAYWFAVQCKGQGSCIHLISRTLGKSCGWRVTLAQPESVTNGLMTFRRMTMDGQSGSNFKRLLVKAEKNELHFYSLKYLVSTPTDATPVAKVKALCPSDTICTMSTLGESYLAVGGKEGCVAVLNSASGTLMWRQYVSDGPILRLELLNDFLLLVQTKVGLQLWDFKASFRLGQLFTPRAGNGSPWGDLYPLDRLHLLQCNKNEIYIWKLCWRSMTVQQPAQDLQWLLPQRATFSPYDPNIIIFSSNINTNLNMWHVKHGSLGSITPSFCELANPNFALWSDRPYVAIVLDMNNIEIYDYSTKSLVKALTCDEEIVEKRVSVLATGELAIPTKAKKGGAWETSVLLFNPEENWSSRREASLTYMKSLPDGLLEVGRADETKCVLHPAKPWLSVQLRWDESFMLNPEPLASPPIISTGVAMPYVTHNSVHLPGGICISPCFSAPTRRVYLSVSQLRHGSSWHLGSLHPGFSTFTSYSLTSAKVVESGDLHLLCTLEDASLMLFVIPARLLRPGARTGWSLHYMKDMMPKVSDSVVSTGFQIYSELTSARAQFKHNWKELCEVNRSNAPFWYILLCTFPMCSSLSKVAKLPQALAYFLNLVRDKSQDISTLAGPWVEAKGREDMESLLVERVYTILQPCLSDEEDRPNTSKKVIYRTFANSGYLPALLELIDLTPSEAKDEKLKLLKEAATLEHGPSMMSYGVHLLPEDATNGKVWVEKALKAGVVPTLEQRRTIDTHNVAEASLEDFPEGVTRDMMGFFVDPCSLTVPSRMVVPISLDGELLPPLALASILALKKSGNMRHPLTRQEISDWKTCHWLGGVLDTGFSELKKHQEGRKRTSGQEGTDTSDEGVKKTTSYRKRQRVEG